MTDELALLGARVREARRRQNLTAEQLAASLKVSCGTITNVETGRTLPILTLLASIANALNVSAASFLRDPSTSECHQAATFVSQFCDLLEDSDWVAVTAVASALVSARQGKRD